MMENLSGTLWRRVGSRTYILIGDQSAKIGTVISKLITITDDDRVSGVQTIDFNIIGLEKSTFFELVHDDEAMEFKLRFIY
jgi:hypothetical protein